VTLLMVMPVPETCASVQTASATKESDMNVNSVLSRAGLEPIGTKANHNLLILLTGKNAQIAPSADLGYTASTRATNSLVGTGG
jgi:hypothetical protein